MKKHYFFIGLLSAAWLVFIATVINGVAHLSPLHLLPTHPLAKILATWSTFYFLAAITLFYGALALIKVVAPLVPALLAGIPWKRK
ncbi:MAG: hypothetical protein V1916_01085 [Patescibacteria group bacterium]